MRYSAVQLFDLLSDDFALVADAREEHVSPAGVVQSFQWVAFRRRS